MDTGEVAEIVSLALRRHTSTLDNAIVLTEEPNVVAVETDNGGTFFITITEA